MVKNILEYVYSHQLLSLFSDSPLRVNYLDYSGLS